MVPRGYRAIGLRRAGGWVALLALGLLGALCLPGFAWAHGIAQGDAAFIAAGEGARVIPFMYLGAKHMVTGYDHLLFILGVIFFLYRMKDIALYVTMFSIGHSITLLSGVLANINVNPFLVDAVIGLSVVYKAFDNLGGFKTLFGVQPDTGLAVFAFGLVHGFGLATKLQSFHLSSDGLVANLVSFNLGVELGQLFVLSGALACMVWWRRQRGFARQAVLANALILCAGFLLMEYQLAGLFADT